jgi:hypothetical protein
MNVEEKAAAALSGSSYEACLGGCRFKFRPMSLSDREEISAIVSGIEFSLDLDKGLGDGEALSEALRCGKYGRRIARFVSTGAHVRGFGSSFRRWRIFRKAYREASTEELVACIRSILDHVEPAFFLGIIISLNRQNILKKTRETGATAPG